MPPTLDPHIAALLLRGLVIPACPLALTEARTLDERRQRALVRYYNAAGAGGLAVGVHTTQFAIRDPAHALFQPVLALAAEEFDRADAHRAEPIVRIGGVCGPTQQAVAEATLLRDLGYHTGLLSLAALRDANEDALIAHARAVADVLPIIGFYLQPAVGGRVLSYAFWRRFAEIEAVAAIKIAPFNRYQTLDVIRAVIDSGRDDIALYTGNDDNIIADLVTPYRLTRRDGGVPGVEGRTRPKPPDSAAVEFSERRIVGGLLGQWAVGTRAAVQLLEQCNALARSDADISLDLLRRNIALTDLNAALFDAANSFAGCIAGIHELLRRQGLLNGIWCLDPEETLSPGQADEIIRTAAAYPDLTDEAFVHEHRDAWLAG